MSESDSATATAPAAISRGAAKGLLATAVAAIIATVVAVEGGYVDNPKDPGGKTNHGVTEKTARGAGYSGDMRALTRDQAIEIYGKGYAYGPRFDQVVLRSKALGTEMIDTGVNLGTRRPGCYLQIALNALNRQQRDYRNVKVDCAVGPATLAAFDALERKRGNRKACELLIKLVDAQQGGHYLSLAVNDSKFEEFMVGWTDTRLGNVPLARCAEGGVR